ncbi:MAG: SpoIID/LytB protein [Actinomycetia bacterium]|nr:SpoIID/LytB protein [Actinomycetes bacterium]
MRRRTLIAVFSGLVTAVGAGSASATSVLIVNGRGWGHGVGMSQWGAEGYAQHGWGWRRILEHYYPGTQLAATPQSRVRVLLAAAQRRADIACAGALAVSDASGRSYRLPTGSYRIGPRLELPVGHKRVRLRTAHRHEVSSHMLVVPRSLRSPVVFDCPTAPLTWNGRAYHGRLVVRRTGRRVSVVNSVALDDYVRGVVGGEMPQRWRIDALAAQAVAARSYALATLKPSRRFDLFSDTRSQVYGGIGYETARTNEAVARTAGRVLTWNGHVASTFFFSTSGGRTADVAEVWPKIGDVPYLRSVADPYDVRSPRHAWGPVVVGATRVAAIFGAALDSVHVERTSSGHAATVVLGRRRIDADEFRKQLGLASTVFTLGELSLDRMRAQVTWGGAVQLVARAYDVGGARLQRRVGAGSWKTLKFVRGQARVKVEPQAHTLYRLSAAGVTGPVVGVTVAPQLRATPVAAQVLSGTVRPLSHGTITVARRVASGWRVVAHPKLDAHGVFHAPLLLRPGAYRVSVAGDGRFAAATAEVQVTTRLLASLHG